MDGVRGVGVCMLVCGVFACVCGVVESDVAEAVLVGALGICQALL